MADHRNGTGDNTADYADYDDEFNEVISLLQMGRVEPMDESPSEDVWNAIAGEIGGDMAKQVLASADSPSADSPGGDASSAGSTPRAANGPGAATVTSLSDRRRLTGRNFAIITAVAAAILLVAVPLGLAFGGGGPDQRADLLALDGFSGSGTAEVTDRTLSLDVEGLDAPDGSFYELWLLDIEGDELEDLTSLGRVDAEGNFTIPADIDLGEFDVIDVSIEPDDGNPDHSGASVLRGGLADA